MDELFAALKGRDQAAVERILAAGADPSAQLESGERPSDLARKHKHPELVPLLEQSG